MTEPMVERLVEEYDIPLPRVFASARMEAERKLLSMSQENLALRELNKRLDKTLRSTQDRLTRCPVTKLHNERFFLSYLEQTIPSYLAEPDRLALAFIGLDRFDETSFEFGKETGDEILRAAAHVLETAKSETDQLFRLDGPSLALLLPSAASPTAVEALADGIRNEIGASGLFIRHLTASIGVSFLSDLAIMEESPEALAANLVNLTRMRMRIARNRGGNRVCMESEALGYSESAGTILVVDPDPVTRDVLRVALEGMSYRVLLSADGEDAFRRVSADPPDLVISEVMLPKIDGFALRERMLESSALKGVPCVFVSHARDPESVSRAQALRVDHFFKKPYLLSELIGTVRLKLQE